MLHVVEANLCSSATHTFKVWVNCIQLVQPHLGDALRLGVDAPTDGREVDARLVPIERVHHRLAHLPDAVV